jgi:transcriptional regulator with XRE-family HTH domain
MTDVAFSSVEEAAGYEFRRLRVNLGWSQEDVAERMTCYGYCWHQTVISKIEAAQRPLRLNEAADLCALFGVTVAGLLTRRLDIGELAAARARIADLERRLEGARKALDGA